jgi:hypothetical protein
MSPTLDSLLSFAKSDRGPAVQPLNLLNRPGELTFRFCVTQNLYTDSPGLALNGG